MLLQLKIKSLENINIRFAIRNVKEAHFIRIISVEKLDAKGSLKKSVNTGQTAGVIALFRNKIWSGIVLTKCQVPRLELSFKDSMKGLKVHEKFISSIHAFNFCHVSPPQRPT